MYFWICRVFGRFNVVCNLGVYCVSHEMGCGTEHSATVLWICSTIAECLVPQLIFHAKWVAEQGIPQLSSGSEITSLHPQISYSGTLCSFIRKNQNTFRNKVFRNTTSTHPNLHCTTFWHRCSVVLPHSHSSAATDDAHHCRRRPIYPCTSSPLTLYLQPPISLFYLLFSGRIKL